MEGNGYWRLLLRSLAALLVCTVLVTICYFFVDKPVAVFVSSHNLPKLEMLKWLTYPPPILQAFVPVVLICLMVRRAWGPFRRWEWTLLAVCVNLLIAVQFKNTLKFVFGRYWPDTWMDDNPSLLQTDSYGFHPFHEGPAYGDFPSGHTARTLAMVSVVWIAYPRWRWLCIVASAAVIAGLIGMDYHFVSDVIAGGFLGAILGTYTAHFFQLDGTKPVPANRDRP